MPPPTRVLLVDADRDDWILTRALLDQSANRRYEVRWAPDVGSALCELDAFRPDAVLAEVQPGNRDWSELLAELGSRADPPPVILLTDPGARTAERAAEEAGAADCLSKEELTAPLLDRSIRYAIRQHELLAEIGALSMTDALTGLHNRRGFLFSVEQQLRTADRQGHRCLAFYAGVDRMGRINETLGRAAGDRALREVTSALRQTFRTSDVIGRIEGDQFAVLTSEADEQSALQMLRRLDGHLRARTIGDLPLEISVGWVTYTPRTFEAVDTVLERASDAMHRAKRRTRQVSADGYRALRELPGESKPRPAIILMAEDDEDDCILVKRALTVSCANAELQIVEDGMELLQYLRREGRYEDPAASPRPGVILLDLNMPRKNGREALREIKADPELRHIPVVVFTTSDLVDDVTQSYDLGASGYITKPASFEGLVAAMRQLGRYWFLPAERVSAEAGD